MNWNARGDSHVLDIGIINGQIVAPDGVIENPSEITRVAAVLERERLESGSYRIITSQL
ncbi:MAG: hypothetical protein KAT13_06020 [Methanosarcinales archaeon]|nr:hypothetical protein [Methanosarcinales archaeon]